MQSNQRSFKSIRFLVSFLALLSFILIVLPAGKGSALYTSSDLTAKLPPAIIGNFFAYNYNTTSANGTSPCYTTPSLNPAITEWTAADNTPYIDVSGTVIDVKAGTTVENFRDWHAMFFCRINQSNLLEDVLSPPDNANNPKSPPPDGTLSNNVLQGYWSYIKSAPPPTVSAPAGYGASVSGLDQAKSNIQLSTAPTDRYFFASNFFSVNFTEPATTTTVAKVIVSQSITTVNVQERHGSYYCTVGGALVSSLNAKSTNSLDSGYTYCPSVQHNITLTFTLEPNTQICIPSAANNNCCTSNCSITIEGLIYHHDNITGITKYITNVPVIFKYCNTGSTNTYTNSSGKFTNTSLSAGESFCVSIPSTYKTNGTTYSNPVITPGYILGVTSPLPGAVGSCNGNGFTEYYQAQVASSPSSPGTCNYGITDNEYNIAYKTSTSTTTIHCIPSAANNYCKKPILIAPCVLPSSGTDYQNITLSPVISGYTIVPYLITPGISTSSATIYEAVPGDYQIKSAYDQYSPATYIISSPTAYQASPNFQLNYYPYIFYYPYDDHNTYVSYDQKATIGTFTASLAYYECGNTYNGTNPTCTYRTTHTSTTTCISYKLGSTCCPSGTTSTIGLNFVTDFVTASYVAVFSGGTGGGGTKSGGGGGTKSGGGGGIIATKYTCTYTTTTTTRYGATAFYRFSLRSSVQTTFPGQTNGPSLNEFCPRNFTVLPPTNTDVNSVILSAANNTPDLPNQATVSTQTTVQFTLNYWSQSIRKSFSVNGINYTGKYYIEHANGSGRVPIASPDNQTFDIGNSNPADIGQPLYAPGNIIHPYSISFPISVPPLEVGDMICAQFSDTPQSGEVNNSGEITNIDSNGPVDSSQIPNRATCSNPVANYPYSRAYGNDIISGINFSNSNYSKCNNQASIIASINPDSGALPRGSGAQFAVLSIGQVAYYASAFLRSATATANNGLTLANTTNTSNIYGGNYDAGCQSIYNYYLNRPQVPTSSATVTNGQTYAVSDNVTSDTVQLSFSSAANSNYIILQANSGNSSSNITGEHVIYIKGNVYIPNDITYDASGDSYNATTGTVSAVPNLYVIASGNIYIGPNVKQLDGIFVAQNQCDWSQVSSSNCDPNSGSGGIINTCSDPSGVGIISSSNESDAFPSDTLYTNCEQQLTVSGALIGHEVKLERTYASMRNSVGGENPIGGSNHSCKDGNGSINPAAAQDCSAEIFNFNPINYLGKPDFSSNGYNFDSIISLPPVL